MAQGICEFMRISEDSGIMSHKEVTWVLFEFMRISEDSGIMRVRPSLPLEKAWVAQG